MSRYLEHRVDYFWNKDASDATRVYNPEFAGRKLYTDPIVSVTSIKVDSSRLGAFTSYSAWASTDYELLPRNAADGPEVRPYDCIRVPEWSSQSLFVPETLVQVVGVFGWAAVPDAVKLAVIHMTAFLRLETPFASRNVIDTGEIIEASPHMRGIINDISRQYGNPRVAI